MTDLKSSHLLPLGLRRMALQDFELLPWRNGAGQTREVSTGYLARDKDSSEAWDWRLSVADIPANGPFSSFPGIDRTAVLLHGAIALKALGCQLALADVGDVETFPGETALMAEVPGGVRGARLLNVMVRRGSCHACVRVHHGPATFFTPSGSHTCLFVASGVFRVAMSPDGAMQAHPYSLTAHELLMWEGSDAFWAVEKASSQGCLIEISIRPPRR